MKRKLQRILAILVKVFHCESFLVLLQRPYLLPRASSYSHPTFRVVKRDGVMYKLDLSDVMQWQIFAKVNSNFGNLVEPYFNNDNIVLDVGANCGEFCLKVAQSAYAKGYFDFRVYAFEPNPIIVERLKNNLSLNEHLRSMVIIIPKALSNTRGFASFNFEYYHSGAGKLGAAQDENTIQVNVTSLDDFIKEIYISNISFIKIDVEGFEGNVLSGGVSVFDKFFPDCYIEVTDKWLTRNNFSKEFIYEFFEKRGYLILREVGDKYVPLRGSDFDLRLQHNILCTK